MAKKKQSKKFDKFKTYKKEINGTVYTAQFKGVRAHRKMINDSHARDRFMPDFEMQEDYLLEHVLVDPAGLTMDDFEDNDEASEVIAFLREVSANTFRDDDESDTGEDGGELAVVAADT